MYVHSIMYAEAIQVTNEPTCVHKIWFSPVDELWSQLSGTWGSGKSSGECLHPDCPKICTSMSHVASEISEDMGTCPSSTTRTSHFCLVHKGHKCHRKRWRLPSSRQPSPGNPSDGSQSCRWWTNHGHLCTQLHSAIPSRLEQRQQDWSLEEKKAPPCSLQTEVNERNLPQNLQDTPTSCNPCKVPWRFKFLATIGEETLRNVVKPSLVDSPKVKSSWTASFVCSWNRLTTGTLTLCALLCGILLCQVMSSPYWLTF